MLNFRGNSSGKSTGAIPKPNFGTVPDVRKIPGSNQITRLLDNPEPEWFAETFNKGLKVGGKHGALEDYRVLDGGVLIPLKGDITHRKMSIANTTSIRARKGKRRITTAWQRGRRW
jgi:hypothetical protein